VIIKLQEEQYTNLEKVPDGAKDVVIIMQLFKNMTWICADDALEKLQTR
jgi:hypothetical protein